MLTNSDPDRNIDQLDADKIYAAIRYLDTDPESERKPSADTAGSKEHADNGIVICVCLYVAVLGCLAVFWLYLR